MSRNVIRVIPALILLSCIALTGAAQEKKGDKKKNDFNPAFWNAGKEILKLHAHLGYSGKSDKRAKGHAYEVYEVNMAQLFGYKIELSSKDFEAVLIIEDAAGKVIAEHDTVLADRTKILHFMPDNYGQRSGVFRIVVTSRKGAVRGYYNLRVSEIGTA